MAYPLGALSIQTALTHDERLQGKIDTSLSHFIADRDDPVVAADSVAKQECDLLGISLYLYNREWFEVFIARLRQMRPSLELFAGGPETMADPHTLLELGIDTLILGEGEETVCNLVHDILHGRSPEGRGIVTKGSGMTGPGYPSDLSKLASPLLTGMADPDHYEGVLWEMTRGCPYHCAFCFESRGNRSVRTYPIERLRQELRLLVDKGVRHVFVLDPTFNMDRERTVDMLTMLRDAADEDMHFTFEVRAELLDEESAKLFGQFHCSLQIGLQSSDHTILRTIGRRFDKDLFSKKIALLNRHHVVFGLDLIIGLPGDTFETFSKSLDFAVGCTPSNLDIFLLALLPGTQLALDADSLGLKHMAGSPYLLTSSHTMTEGDIAKALRLKQACDLLYTKGRADMWTMVACRALDMRPSRWFSEFADHLEKHPELEGEEIFSIQDAFVRHQFERYGKQDLLPAMMGFIELHQGIAYLQDTGESPVVQLPHSPDELALLDTVALDSFVHEYPGFGMLVPHMVFLEGGTLFVEPMSEW